MDEESKVVNKLNKDGQCVVIHCWQDEPDFWFVFAIWKMSGERNLYLYFDDQTGKYIFYFKSAKKRLKLAKNKVYYHYDVKTWVKDEVGHYISFAKRIIKTVSTKGFYLLKDKERIQQLEDDYETLTGLISWYSDGRYDEDTAGMVSDGDKPYFIVGDSDLVLKKLKRMGYKTVLTYDETGKPFREMLLDADFGGLKFDFEFEEEIIDEYITEEIQREFGDCIWSSHCDSELNSWLYELSLSDEYTSSVKRFIKQWNAVKPFNIRCKQVEAPIGLTVLFKNGFKYSK